MTSVYVGFVALVAENMLNAAHLLVYLSYPFFFLNEQKLNRLKKKTEKLNSANIRNVTNIKKLFLRSNWQRTNLAQWQR